MKGNINGKPAGEVFALLRGEIPGVVNHTDDSGYPYLEYAVLQPFFEGLVPPQNYDFDCSEATFQLFPNGGGIVSCAGTITICDDEGNALRKKAYIGAANLAVSKATGKIVDAASATRSAVTNCKKGCMLGFGCGDHQLKDEKGKKRSSDKNKHTSDITKSTSPNYSNHGSTDIYLVKMRSDIKVISGIKYILVPVTMDEIKTCVLIWRNRFKNADAIANKIAAVSSIYIEGTYEKLQDKDRIVFKGFPDKSGIL